MSDLFTFESLKSSIELRFKEIYDTRELTKSSDVMLFFVMIHYMRQFDMTDKEFDKSCHHVILLLEIMKEFHGNGKHGKKGS